VTVPHLLTPLFRLGKYAPLVRDISCKMSMMHVSFLHNKKQSGNIRLFVHSLLYVSYIHIQVKFHGCGTSRSCKISVRIIDVKCLNTIIVQWSYSN
jgi:hypothetical protein